MNAADKPQAPETPWEKLVRLASVKTGQRGYSAIAALLGLSPQAVRLWNRIVPVKHCPKLELLLDGQMSRAEMRPDHFGPVLPAMVLRTEARAQ